MKMDRRSFLTMTGAALAAAHGHADGDEEKLRACIIGDTEGGGYGHHLDVLFALQPTVEVVGLADPHERGRAFHAERSNARRTYADYREMLEKERPDLAVVAPRWPSRHKEYLLACAETGTHGFIEKPLCIDLAEADAMVDAIEAKNLKWAIAFNVRALPTVAHLRKLLWEDELIGTVMEARGRGKEDHRVGGEDLIVLGVHIFDLMRYLVASEPTWCHARVTCDGRPVRPGDVHDPTEPLGPVVGDTIHAAYGFANGVAGFFDTVKTPDGNGGRFGLDIYGSRGVVALRFDSYDIYWLGDAQWSPGHTGAKWQPIPDAPALSPGIEKDPRQRNKPIVDDWLAAVHEDRIPAVSLQDGRHAQAMIQAVFESCVQDKRVTMPLENRTHPLKRRQAWNDA